MGSPRHRILLVVVADLHVVSIVLSPTEADPPLVVDSNAVLSGAIPRQPLEPVARRCAEVLETLCAIDQEQLPVCTPLHISRKPPRTLALEHLPRFAVA